MEHEPDAPILAQIAARLRAYPPVPVQPEPGQREAAVLLALTRAREPEVVFIKRAEHLNSHRGQVAFPGGMWEASDASLLDTALRESEEEVALPRHQVEVIARLPRRTTRTGTPVTPYLGVVPGDVPLRHDPSELDAVFRVPLGYLLQQRHLVSSEFELLDGCYEMPCYHYGDYRIWGFTLNVLIHFLNTALDARLGFAYLHDRLPAHLRAHLIELEEEDLP
ncbi:MAG: CoA pyrophosphatase [Gammaproteobacteria bacterium]|nr:CoA pyrophosphatase [Gammaproteobacteria bacterium]